MLGVGESTFPIVLLGDFCNNCLQIGKDVTKKSKSKGLYVMKHPLQ